jgi:hypothetical protein
MPDDSTGQAGTHQLGASCAPMDGVNLFGVVRHSDDGTLAPSNLVYERQMGLHDTLRQIQESWQNRLLRKPISFAKDYLDGNFGLVFYLYGGGHLNNRPLLVCVENAAFYIDASTILGGSDDSFYVVNCECSQQHPVLLDNVQLVDDPDRKVPVLVRLYLVDDEPIDLFEGLLYQSCGPSLKHVRKVLPRFVSWKGHLGRKFGVHVPGDAGPYVVQACGEVVHDVSHQQGNASVELVRAYHQLIKSGFRVVLHPDHVTASFVDDSFQVAEALFGPFNLEP